MISLMLELTPPAKELLDNITARLESYFDLEACVDRAFWIEMIQEFDDLQAQLTVHVWGQTDFEKMQQSLMIYRVFCDQTGRLLDYMRVDEHQIDLLTKNELAIRISRMVLQLSTIIHVLEKFLHRLGFHYAESEYSRDKGWEIVGRRSAQKA